MPKTSVRTRFAPSPSGSLHLGNIRAALINWLFYRQNNGDFLLRIENTDKDRSCEKLSDQIIQDLSWLKIEPSEGFGTNKGNFGPYEQSKRTEIYEKVLNQLICLNLAYPCFCSKERLDEVRSAQIREKKPPRYDKTCANLSAPKIEKKKSAGLDFVYRFRLDDKQKITVNDMAKGKVNFDLKNFSDPIISRSDKSYTFLFTNMVDDMLMEITHIIRGEDHLSNSAIQAAINFALRQKPLTFLHLPMICDISGKKMSKRSGNFDLESLKKQGILPEAINNYLANLGLSGTENEIYSLDELAKSYNFEKISSQSSCKYDFEKLEWINKKWISKLSGPELWQRIKKLLKLNQEKNEERIIQAIELIKNEAKNLIELWDLSSFMIQKNELETSLLIKQFDKEEILKGLNFLIKAFENENLDQQTLKQAVKDSKMPAKLIFTLIRFATTGKIKGIGINIIFELLTAKEIIIHLEELKKALK